MGGGGEGGKIKTDKRSGGQVKAGVGCGGEHREMRRRRFDTNSPDSLTACVYLLYKAGRTVVGRLVRASGRLPLPMAVHPR